MTSPALDAFTTWVDSTTIQAANKTAAKARGVTLYEATTQEEAAHIIRHLDAAIVSASGEDLTRLQRLRLIADALTIETSPHLATEVAALIIRATPLEERVMQALGYILMSKTVQQASDRWDDMASGGIPAGVVTRLKALRDLITSKLGA